MRFWWVNQNRTFRHEVDGGYLWSPKRKANGRINPFYEAMREVAPGDLVFSFADRRIAALGVVSSHAYESPKPVEFGRTGFYWDRIGWRVDVRFTLLPGTFRPADWIDRLRPLQLATLIGPEVETLARAGAGTLPSSSILPERVSPFGRNIFETSCEATPH